MEWHEIYVSIETAKLLKQAGFDWYTNLVYVYDKLLTNPYTADWNNTIPDTYTSAPTLDIAQKWLREVKGIRFYITPKYYSHFNDNGEFTHESFAWYDGACDDFDDLEACYIGGLKKGDKVNEEGISECVRKTYEEVLDEGLQRCLTLLLNNKK